MARLSWELTTDSCHLVFEAGPVVLEAVHRVEPVGTLVMPEIKGRIVGGDWNEFTFDHRVAHGHGAGDAEYA